MSEHSVIKQFESRRGDAVEAANKWLEEHPEFRCTNFTTRAGWFDNSDDYRQQVNLVLEIRGKNETVS